MRLLVIHLKTKRSALRDLIKKITRLQSQPLGIMDHLPVVLTERGSLAGCRLKNIKLLFLHGGDANPILLSCPVKYPACRSWTG